MADTLKVPGDLLHAHNEGHFAGSSPGSLAGADTSAREGDRALVQGEREHQWVRGEGLDV